MHSRDGRNPLKLLKIVPFLCSLTFGSPMGAWYKTVQQIPPPLDSKFEPSFVLLKVANFSNKGYLKVLIPKEQILKTCQKKAPLQAWVTHKLGKGEEISKVSGAKLAKELNRFLSGTCITKVELDIEPLDMSFLWLKGFAEGVKEEKKDLEIRFATYQLSGDLLGWSDGVDLMLYDTGLKTKEEYFQLVKQSILHVNALLSQFSDRSIYLGVPAYQDKTTRHSENIENLQTVLEVLNSLSLSEGQYFCSKRMRISIFAGWTLRQKELNWISKINEWHKTQCKKDT